jgi:phosphoribosylaminoimidazole carboxylase (NCAIR synthetase)
MILHVLGAGPAQLNLIKRIKEMGHEVAVSDMNPRAPGLALADYPSVASSFDPEAIKEAALEARSDRLLTMGTDQPVLTAALVSQQLGLPYFLTAEQAALVTNKKVMKEMFLQRQIPTAPFRFLSSGFDDSELEGLHFPLVMKPLDSQGQRGVLKVQNISEIRVRMDEVLGFSRENQILVEEYYPSEEVTVSGWVCDKKVHLFSITDRVTIENDPYMGVCVSHRYPSLFHRDWKELEDLTRKICHSVDIKEGPIYFQILGGDQGFRVNEIACRLGGAYEDEFLPPLCGVDPLTLLIGESLGSGCEDHSLEAMATRRESLYCSLQMFFCRPGIICSQTGMDSLSSIPGFGAGRFLLSNGTQILNRENSTQRAGYFFFYGNSAEDLNRKVRRAYDALSILDENGEEMIERSEKEQFPDE